jgi:hypothetical protein
MNATKLFNAAAANRVDRVTAVFAFVRQCAAEKAAWLRSRAKPPT